MIAIYKQPILTVVFRIIGIVCLIVSIAVGIIILRAGAAMKEETGETEFVWSAIGTMGGGILAFLFYWGIAQVIDFLGKSAFYSEQMFLQSSTRAGVLGKGRAVGSKVPDDSPESASTSADAALAPPSGERTKFECGGCGQRISAMASEIGSHIACPNCGEDVVVA